MICVLFVEGGQKQSGMFFFYCDFSKVLWRPMIRDEQLCEEVLIEDNQKWDKLLDMLHSKGLADQGMYLCWLIWNNRNECLHKMVCRSQASLITMAAKLVKDFNTAVTRLPMN